MFKNKKGFSLIEMLVVIAIIAILVAMVLPKFATETIKSAAATNAANLRTVVGQLAVKRAMNDDGFEEAYQSSVKTAGNYINNAVSPLLEMLGWSNYSDWANEWLYGCEADSNGNLYWKDASKVFLEGVPAAKKMKFEDANGNVIQIAEGERMKVYISDSEIVATYLAMDGTELGIDDFADIAEDGKYDGGATASNKEDDFWSDVEGDINAATCRDHHPDGNNNCYCTSCRTNDHNSDHQCTRCGLHNITDVNGDGNCDMCKVDEYFDGCARCGVTIYVDIYGGLCYDCKDYIKCECGNWYTGSCGNTEYHGHQCNFVASNGHKCNIEGCDKKGSCDHGMTGLGKCDCGYRGYNCPNC